MGLTDISEDGPDGGGDAKAMSLVALGLLAFWAIVIGVTLALVT